MANETKMTVKRNGKLIELTNDQAARLVELNENEDLPSLSIDSELAQLGLAEPLDEGVHRISQSGERLLGAVAYLNQPFVG